MIPPTCQQLFPRPARASRLLRRSVPLLMALCVLLGFDLAHANGRFPLAQQLRALDSQRLILTGTYGLLASTGDGGFRFVCESELFAQAAPMDLVDPLLEILPDGTLFTGSTHALRVSKDGGCTFRTETSLPVNPAFFDSPPAGAPLRGRIMDITPMPTPEAVRLLVLASIADEAGTVLEHRFYRSKADSSGFDAFGSAIPLSLTPLLLTVDVAPSDPNRIYLSGGFSSAPLLLVSRDGGATWNARPVSVDDADTTFGLYIAGVDPKDANRVYLRVSRWTDTESGALTWDDSLIVTRDGGDNFEEILRKQGNLLGFSLTADGETVFAGYGDPQIAAIVTSPEALGIYVANSQHLDFEQRVPDLSVSCLRWIEGALYACAREWDPLGNDPTRANDFHLGVHRAGTLPSARSDFTTLLKLKDIRGPLLWADGRSSTCEAEWNMPDPTTPDSLSTCQMLNACESAGGGRTEVPQCGTTTAGGAGGAGMQASGGNSGGTARGSSSAPSGCGCRTAPRNGPEAALVLLLVAAVGTVRSRRRVPSQAKVLISKSGCSGNA